MKPKIEDLIQGQKDPGHGRKVKTLVVQTASFYVFIDDSNEIYYYVHDDDFKYPENFNALHSKIRRLEILVLNNLEEKYPETYNYLLANNLGEALEEKDITRAFTELESIEKDINILVNTTHKQHFRIGTNIAAGLVMVMIYILFLNKDSLEYTWSKSVFQLIFCSLFGGIGALIFNYSKSKTYTINRVIGKLNSFFEGGLRIFYGIIYALIIILGIKAGMVMNFVNQNPNSFSLMAFIGVLAGASDTFITGILRSMEKSVSEEEKNIQKK